MTDNPQLPLPGAKHGQRLAISILDERAQSDPQSPWVSVPVDDEDLSKGYTDITYRQFANAVNHATHWLAGHLPSSEEPFQCFAYVGPKDLRYPILAMAAGKLGKVMVLPSPMMTPEAQLHILDKKNCNLYVRAESMASTVDHIFQRRHGLEIITGPELEELLQDKQAEPFLYRKSWEEGKDDPWLTFHTSGTTGYPKPVTYSHQMMAIVDVFARLKGDGETFFLQYISKRWFTPMPMIHFMGMLMVLSMSTFFRTVVVLGPSKPPSPETIMGILKYGRVDGALLVPAIIDALCRSSSGLAALRSLKYIHYVGAPLGVESAKKLVSDVSLLPVIGSTEGGGYFTKLRNDTEDWDYVEFSPYIGAELEPRAGGLHELVFVRKPEYAAMQLIFMLYPDLDRFETKDLWVEHPTRKGLWKIVGRTDDYVTLSHGDGLYASTVEREIERHELVQAALIGGHGKPKPVLLIETVPETHGEGLHEDFMQSLLPYLEKANALSHDSVRISPELVLLAKPEKPFVRTVKGNVARLPSLSLYKQEIETAY